MDKTTALKVLTKHYNAPYEGTFTSATSGDLIHDIMWEGEMGNTCLLYTSPSPRD